MQASSCVTLPIDPLVLKLPQESLFFATEALTVYQWSRTSDRIGRKPVLIIGLIGTMLSMLSFGLSRTFFALVVRSAFALHTHATRTQSATFAAAAYVAC